MTPLVLALALADPCPAIAIRPLVMPHVSQPAFYAMVDPYPIHQDAPPITYQWRIAKGELLQGDYARDTYVRLDLDELTQHAIDFDLTVEIAGLPEGCPHQVSAHFVEPRYAGPPLARGEGGARCPRIEIVGQGADHLTGTFYVAHVDPMPRDPIGYGWWITGAGKLFSGADERFASVEVNLAELMEQDVSFELGLDVGGLPKGCPHTTRLPVTMPRYDGFPPRR